MAPIIGSLSLKSYHSIFFVYKIVYEEVHMTEVMIEFIDFNGTFDEMPP